MKPQIVLMIPLGEAPPGVGQPPGINYPTFPGQLPMPGGPGQPPYPSTGPGFPTPPIAPGGSPPGVDNTLPVPPVDPSWGVQPPVDPGYGRPDISTGRPDNTLPLPPDSPAEPGQVYPPLADLHTKTATLAWLPGWGYRWIVLGPTQPDNTLPGAPPNQPAMPAPHLSPRRR